MKNIGLSRFTVLILALSAIGLTALSACSDSPSDPGPGGGAETVESLEVQLPDSIVPGRAFEVRVVAVGSAGTRPFTGFTGTVGLTVSVGTVNPSSLSVTDGQGTAEVVVQTSAASVELSVSHSDARGSAEVNCAKPGSVLVTSGRFYLLVAANAGTLSGSVYNEDESSAQMPGQMDFSDSFSMDAESIHLFDPDDPSSERLVATSSATGDLMVTSTLDGPDRLVSMSISSTTSASASFTGSSGQGGASGTGVMLTEFDFTVETAPLIVAFVGGEFEDSSYTVKDADGRTVINTFSEHSATIGPGEYSFIAKYTGGTGTSGGTSQGTAGFTGTLSFTEAPPEE